MPSAGPNINGPMVRPGNPMGTPANPGGKPGNPAAPVNINPNGIVLPTMPNCRPMPNGPMRPNVQPAVPTDSKELKKMEKARLKEQKRLEKERKKSLGE